MSLSKYITITFFIFWPISLFLKNTFTDFLIYFFPTILFFISFELYNSKNTKFFLPLLIIPFFSAKLAPIPFVFSIFLFLFDREKYSKNFSIISLLIFVIFFKSFWGQTIFHPDYEANQLILRNINLYPSVYFARMFQNKAVVFANKLTGNFFSLIDPTNYFFAFHPRENYISNQNLDKFPYFSLVFFMVGIYNLKKIKEKKYLSLFFITCILVLSILTNFDRNDFILFIPIAIIILNGYKIFTQNIKVFFKKSPKVKLKAINITYLIFTFHEFIRLFLK